VFLLSIALLSSCRGVDVKPIGQARQQIGTSNEGVPIYASFYQLDEEGFLLPNVPRPTGTFDGETLLLFGVIHGDEPLGMPLLERLEEVLQERCELVSGRRIIIVPLLNPDGYRLGIRVNTRGVDLNRNFPSTSWKRLGHRHGAEPASEPETRALMDLVNTYRPTRILSIHAPLHCVNYDGPAESVAQKLAVASGYPLMPHIGYPTPGSFGSWAGIDREIPVITLELREGLRQGEVWEEMGQAMIEFVQFGDSGRVAK
jgi:protein MpaA